MNLRNGILIGLALSVFTVLFTLGNILLNFRGFLTLMTGVVLWYGYCAICRTSARASEDKLFLYRGVKWGVAIGCLWAITVLAGFTIGLEYAPTVAFLALILPFVAGASSAISCRKVRMGTRVGFWSGVISGLIGFFVFTALAYLRPLVLGVPVFAAMENDEYGAFQLAVFILFLYGPIFCPVAGTVGGWIGLQLEKTGRPSGKAIPSSS